MLVAVTFRANAEYAPFEEDELSEASNAECNMNEYCRRAHAEAYVVVVWHLLTPGQVLHERSPAGDCSRQDDEVKEE